MYTCAIALAMMISYAQNFEDVILWRVLRDVSSGFYVDVGAFHPEIDSVTKWFYDHGWNGINIEPVPESYAQLEAARTRDRNIRVAAGAQAGTGLITIFPASRGLSSLHPSHTAAMERKDLEVEVLPLHQILQPYAEQAIHFLKVDAEGSEREVLLGMDFSRFRPWVVLVEATAPESQTRISEHWQETITKNGYKKVYFDGLNEFFLASERMELASRFEVPPNVFDDFELAAILREREWRREMESVLRGEIRARDDELSTARKQIDSTEATLGSTQAALALSEAAVAKLNSDRGELARALQTSRETLDQVFKSRSWRWLAPIRNINFALRSYRENLRRSRLFRTE